MSKMLEKFAAQSLVEYDGELIFSKEKFAELIVKECIRVGQKEFVNDTSKYPAFPVKAIKQHFGVEEWLDFGSSYFMAAGIVGVLWILLLSLTRKR